MKVTRAWICKDNTLTEVTCEYTPRNGDCMRLTDVYEYRQYIFSQRCKACSSFHHGTRVDVEPYGKWRAKKLKDTHELRVSDDAMDDNE